MCSSDKCNFGGIRRVQCLKCGKYFDLCPNIYHKDSVCPYCGEYFIGFGIGQARGFIKEVPWWYGKPIPGWLEVEWGENHGLDPCALIPEFYLHVHMYLSAKNGKPITELEARRYFAQRAKEYWGLPIIIMGNEEWDRIRAKNSLHIY